MNKETVQLAAQAFVKVPGKFQQYFKQLGVDFSDDLVAQIKENPDSALKMLQEDEKFLNTVVSLFEQNRDEIMKEINSKSMFKDGGKLAFAVEKFQIGGLLKGFGKQALSSGIKSFLGGEGDKSTIGGIVGSYAGSALRNNMTGTSNQNQMNGFVSDMGSVMNVNTARNRTQNSYTYPRISTGINTDMTDRNIPRAKSFEEGGEVSKFQDSGKMIEVPVITGSYSPSDYHSGKENWPVVDYNGTYARVMNYAPKNRKRIHQLVVTSGYNGTPRRSERIIYEPGTAQADTVYVDANGYSAHKNPRFLEGKGHSAEFINTIDGILNQTTPVYKKEGGIIEAKNGTKTTRSEAKEAARMLGFNGAQFRRALASGIKGSNEQGIYGSAAVQAARNAILNTATYPTEIPSRIKVVEEVPADKPISAPKEVRFGSPQFNAMIEAGKKSQSSSSASDDFTSAGSFGKAFAAASKAGLKEFTFNGKRFTTQLKEEASTQTVSNKNNNSNAKANSTKGQTGNDPVVVIGDYSDLFDSINNTLRNPTGISSDAIYLPGKKNKVEPVVIVQPIDSTSRPAADSTISAAPIDSTAIRAVIDTTGRVTPADSLAIRAKGGINNLDDFDYNHRIHTGEYNGPYIPNMIYNADGSVSTSRYDRPADMYGDEEVGYTLQEIENHYADPNVEGFIYDDGTLIPTDSAIISARNKGAHYLGRDKDGYAIMWFPNGRTPSKKNGGKFSKLSIKK